MAIIDNIRLKKMMKNLAALVLGVIISFGIAEAFLRIYNPFGLRLKGNQIVLPTNVKMIVKNDRIPALESTIIHTKNSLGFRGEELPKVQDKYFKIIVVGGSTTECFYISDHKTWPAILATKLQEKFGNIWLNNAGLDGHSTFGHIILLRDYLVKLRPEMIIFLVGVNDIGRDDLGSYDKAMLRNFQKSHSFLRLFASYSECVNLLLNIYRNSKARNRNLAHTYLDLNNVETLDISEAEQQKILESHKDSINSYRRRLEVLIEISEENGIIPVFITQPALYGCGIDPSTDIDLSSIKLRKNLNGCLAWKTLEAYNQVTRTVAEEKNVLIIDLARKLPHDSHLFYDMIHFNNNGSKVVGEILYQEIYLSIKEHIQG